MIELFSRTPNAGRNQTRTHPGRGRRHQPFSSPFGYSALAGARRIVDGISLADETILIPFKARAFLDLSARKEAGEGGDARHISKHRADVFRLVQLLPGGGNIDLSDPIREDLAGFLAAVRADENFDYSVLKLPLDFDDATSTLTRFHQLP